MREKLAVTEKVILDKQYHNSSIVEVVSQTPNRLFTRVKGNEVEWDVMTYRLTKLNK